MVRELWPSSRNYCRPLFVIDSSTCGQVAGDDQATKLDVEFWIGPGEATPAQSLYSARTREIGQKGDASPFVKADKGLFGVKQ